MAAPHSARLRAKVLRLAAEGMTNRAIARRANISESTVRRWRTTDAPDDAPPTHNDAPPAHESTPDDAPMTHPDAPTAAPPDTLTVLLDDELRYHLATLAEAGHDAQTAITLALTTLADSYAYAWDYGITTRGTVPAVHIHIDGDPMPRPRT